MTKSGFFRIFGAFLAVLIMVKLAMFLFEWGVIYDPLTIGTRFKYFLTIFGATVTLYKQFRVPTCFCQVSVTV